MQTFSIKLNITRVLPTKSDWHAAAASPITQCGTEVARPGSLHSSFSSGLGHLQMLS